MLKKVVIALVLVLWPLNFILSQNYPPLSGLPQTIFVRDYEAEQLILRNTQLYPTVLTARVFQNKGRIYLNKFLDNFFALTDPNYYFFGLHPRPIVPDNKNLFKYPFVAIAFFLYGIYHIGSFKYKNQVAIFGLIAVIFLSILKNFDGYDMIMWPPVSALIIHGVNSLEKSKKRLWPTLAIIFILFAIPEVLRSFYSP